jgi:hypothetical protein
VTSLRFYLPPTTSQGLPPWLVTLSAPPAPHGWLGLMSGPAVHGFASPWQLGGVVVQPAALVLGLKPWEDAFEGVIPAAPPVPWVRFDLEKLIRMALHQSGLALELLGGAPLEPGPIDPHAIAAGAITRQQLSYWRDTTRHEVATPPAAALEWLGLVRRVLTGYALAQDARYVAWLPELLASHAPASLAALVAPVLAGEALEEAARGASAPLLASLWDRLDPEAPCALPERPSDYDGLERMLVAARLAC